MREIKFRVWDKDFKRMHVCGEDIHDEIDFEQETNKAYYYNLQNGCGSLTENSAYILMQYTGLRDKNGKEIYEGDIVKNSFYPEHIFEVCFKDYKWYVRKIKTSEHITLSDIANLKAYYDTEVIGNIYDNPELLESEEK